MFISFEGGEGTGKTSVIRILDDLLKKDGFKILTTREPGGTMVAELIRSIILNPSNKSITPHTEAVLYAASRVQHLDEIIKPAIREGYIILCDRFLDSSLAYQGFARGLGFDFINKINTYALENLPNITFYFDLDPKIGLERIKNRSYLDRLDLEDITFHDKVRQGYIKIWEENKQRITLIDASRDINSIALECYKIIKTHI